MAIAQFINVDYLKKNSTIQMNVDNDTLTPYILLAQDTHIAEAIGSSFYDHLQNAVATSATTSDELYFLTTFVQPALAQWALWLVLPFLDSKITNKGIVNQNSEWSTTAEEAKYKRMSNAVRDMAEFKLKRLVKYLCDNSILFPEYRNPTSPENLPRNGKAYFSGMYLGNADGGSRGRDRYHYPKGCNNC